MRHPTSTVIFLAMLLGSKCHGATNVAASAAKIALGTSYSKARDTLMEAGWQIDQEWCVSGRTQKLTFPQFPEVLCGEGYDALCTGRFMRKGQAILMTFDQHKKKLSVTRIDND